MSTVTRERAQAPLPQTGRGDVMLAAVALLVCLLALVLKLTGIALIAVTRVRMGAWSPRLVPTPVPAQWVKKGASLQELADGPARAAADVILLTTARVRCSAPVLTTPAW